MEISRHMLGFGWRLSCANWPSRPRWPARQPLVGDACQGLKLISVGATSASVGAHSKNWSSPFKLGGPSLQVLSEVPPSVSGWQRGRRLRPQTRKGEPKPKREINADGA